MLKLLPLSWTIELIKLDCICFGLVASVDCSVLGLVVDLSSIDFD